MRRRNNVPAVVWGGEKVGFQLTSYNSLSTPQELGHMHTFCDSCAVDAGDNYYVFRWSNQTH